MEDSRRADMLKERTSSLRSDEGLVKSVFASSFRRRMETGRSTFVHGVSKEKLDEFTSLLLFHDSLLLRMCRSCVKRTPRMMIEPLLNRGLASIVLIDEPTKTPPWFQEVMASHPELFVGPKTMRAWVLRCQSRFANWGYLDDRQDKATDVRVESLTSQARSMSPRLAHEYEFALHASNTIRGTLALELIELIERSMEHPDLNEARALHAISYMADYIMECRVWHASPQFDERYLSNIPGPAPKMIGVARPSGLSYEQYLDIIGKHLGSLSPASTVGADLEILARVERWNDEIDSLVRSSRMKAARLFSTWVVPILPIAAAIFQGRSFREDHVTGSPAAQHGPLPANRLPTKLVAGFFGVSTESVRIWKVRRELGRDS